MEKKIIKGIIARDNTNWQIEFENAVKDSGCGVMWKDQISDLWEIKDKLLYLISNQGYIDFYNIAKSFSNYHGKIVDFATKDDYPEKMQVWKKKNPAWFSESFDGYSDDRQKAIIAFLVEDFESIPEKERIHINQFITFNKKQAWIKNAVAYTDIITMDKIKQQTMINKIKELLLSNKNLILTGAPGTGKTYLTKQIARLMLFGKVDEEELNETEKQQFEQQFDFVQFHPSFDYTDFVEGLRPIEDEKGNVSFRREDGIFMKFCRKALEAYNKAEKKEKAPKYVFVIDEINRGDLSKIFGELFFCIDPGYRGEKGKVKTQYSNLWKNEKYGDSEFFYIPENVYIIGTMNDIDRSVESMDFAMRRRFAFKEVHAEDRADMIKENAELSPFFSEINERMMNLNLAILTIQGLSTAYQIGPAYFLKLKNYLTSDGKINDNSYENLWNNHLCGVLYEYLRGLPSAEEDMETLHRAYKLVEKYKIENGKATKE